MALALDEPKKNDERIDVQGFSFILANDVAETIRYYGGLAIDYLDRPFMKGFRLQLAGSGSCS
jgi:hypothetical protein